MACRIEFCHSARGEPTSMLKAAWLRQHPLQWAMIARGRNPRLQNTTIATAAPTLVSKWGPSCAIPAVESCCDSLQATSCFLMMYPRADGCLGGVSVSGSFILCRIVAQFPMRLLFEGVPQGASSYARSAEVSPEFLSQTFQMVEGSSPALGLDRCLGSTRFGWELAEVTSDVFGSRHHCFPPLNSRRQLTPSHSVEPSRPEEAYHWSVFQAVFLLSCTATLQYL